MGNVHADFCGSLLRTGQHLQAGKIRWQSKFFTGASAVQIARGVLTAQFMASGYSHLLFIDADLGWEPDSIKQLLVASAHHDVCCAVYPKKAEPLQFPVNFEMDGDRPIVHPETGYLALKDACSGFLMIRRHVLVEMINAYPERKCTFRQDGLPEEERFEYNLFDMFIDPATGRYLSEDFGFSRLYQGIGGTVWADPDIRLAHHGHKKYEGCIRDLMEPVESEAAA